MLVEVYVSSWSDPAARSLSPRRARVDSLAGGGVFAKLLQQQRGYDWLSLSCPVANNRLVFKRYWKQVVGIIKSLCEAFLNSMLELSNHKELSVLCIGAYAIMPQQETHCEIEQLIKMINRSWNVLTELKLEYS